MGIDLGDKRRKKQRECEREFHFCRKAQTKPLALVLVEIDSKVANQHKVSQVEQIYKQNFGTHRQNEKGKPRADKPLADGGSMANYIHLVVPSLVCCERASVSCCSRLKNCSFQNCAPYGKRSRFPKRRDLWTGQ